MPIKEVCSPISVKGSKVGSNRSKVGSHRQVELLHSHANPNDPRPDSVPEHPPASAHRHSQQPDRPANIGVTGPGD
jgi:hypothetical protein